MVGKWSKSLGHSKPGDTDHVQLELAIVDAEIYAAKRRHHLLHLDLNRKVSDCSPIPSNAKHYTHNIVAPCSGALPNSHSGFQTPSANTYRGTWHIDPVSRLIHDWFCQSMNLDQVNERRC